MVFILPTDDELSEELEKRSGDYLDAEMILKDTVWDFKFTQAVKVDPADVHGI